VTRGRGKRIREDKKKRRKEDKGGKEKRKIRNNYPERV
jgi:hypothetical protein